MTAEKKFKKSHDDMDKKLYSSFTSTRERLKMSDSKLATKIANRLDINFVTVKNYCLFNKGTDGFLKVAMHEILEEL